MAEWEILGLEPTDDCSAINSAFVKRAIDIDPSRSASEYRYLYSAYKDALRYALRKQAINSGKRSDDLDFDFSDDRYLAEFMLILDNICTGGLKQSPSVWEGLINDSDYRTLQRTDRFITEFDEYMSGVSGLDPRIWRFLAEHFTVYGFSAQNEKLVADLKQYGNIENDVFLKKASEPSDKITKQRESLSEQDSPAQGVDNTLLSKYMKLQNDKIVNERSAEFFTKFGRVYSHDITKNNMSAWRYLMQQDQFTYLLKQEKFTEKLVNSLRHINDLYPSVWEYIIDKTRVPRTHPSYEKSTGELIRLMKQNSYKGNTALQAAISTDMLKSLIDDDNFTKGHHEYQQGRPAGKPVKTGQANGLSVTKQNERGNNTKQIIIVVAVIIAILIRLLIIFD